jgi:hypothetical protein
MKHYPALLAFFASAALTAHAVQLIPAGSKMECIVSEKVSSKTMQVGDPVLCQVNHSEMYGRSVFPYGSYVTGRFEEYKDPGHFVGKGWMELRFDKLVVGNDTEIPIASRVIATSQKNPVDNDGKIHGTGHPVKDTIEWLIPVLWPIDLINLPRRGPTPTLKPEARLTILLMEDVGIPTKNEVQHQPEMVSRYNYADNQPEQQAAAPIERAYQQPMQQPMQQPIQQAYAQPMQPVYAQPVQQPSPTVVVVQAAAPAAPTIIQQQAPPVVVQQRPPVVYGYPPPPGYYYPRYYRP